MTASIPPAFLHPGNRVKADFFKGNRTPASVRRFLPFGCFLTRKNAAENADERARLDELYTWVEENTRGPWMIMRAEDMWMVQFAREHDAVHFALRFPHGMDGPEGFE